MTTFESLIGRKLAIDHHYWGWTDSWPASRETGDVASGRYPMVSWNYPQTLKLDAILNGSQDSVIRARARAVKSFGHPLLLRWGYEMNDHWFSWSGAQNGDDPSKYVAAWRHIVDIFRAEGAANALWVWSPGAQDNPSPIYGSQYAWNHWTNYYPGDDYVDWVAVDGYNWGTTQSWSSWQSFATVFGGSSSVYRDYAGRKPIMIAEVGSAEQGGDKGAWFRDTLSQMETNFPAIKAIVYFDTIGPEGVDWRAESSSGSLDGFRTLASNPYLNPSAASSTVASVGDTSAPSAPAGLAKTASAQTSISIGWSPSSDNVGVAGYGLYRNGTKVDSTSGTSTTFGGLACGTSYTLGVDAYDLAGNRSSATSLTASTSACSTTPTPDTTAPSTPGALARASSNLTSIAVTWSASTDNVGVAGYGLYRDGSRIDSTPGTKAWFGGLACGKSYTLGVDAYDAAGNRSGTASLTASTSACSTTSTADTTPPSAPAGLAKTASAQTSISIGWSPSSDNVGVAGYGLYRNGTKVDSTSGTSTTFGGLACGTSYTLAVDAYDGAGNRSGATALAASTDACVQPPTNDTPPAVTGTARRGETLSASSGSWSGTAPMTFGYQWRRCDSSGGGCGDVSGATGPSYTVAQSDVGSTLRISVTAGNSAGSQAATSTPTGVVDRAHGKSSSEASGSAVSMQVLLPRSLSVSGLVEVIRPHVRTHPSRTHHQSRTHRHGHVTVHRRAHSHRLLLHAAHQSFQLGLLRGTGPLSNV